MPIFGVLTYQEQGVQDYFYTVDEAFDANGQTFDLPLDPTLFPVAGEYAIVGSKTAISNLDSPVANVTWIGGVHPLGLSVLSFKVERRFFNGDRYETLVAVVG